MYAPDASMTSKFVLVPRSTTIAGPPNSLRAASAFARRSAPASDGRSMAISSVPASAAASTVTG
jgi:hypothetical protein